MKDRTIKLMLMFLFHFLLVSYCCPLCFQFFNS